MHGDDRGVKGFSGHQRIHSRQETESPVHLSDEELDEWKKHRNDFAKEWTNGYDKELVIKNKNLYDLRAIPTLYLLDKNKTVLLKDATLQKVEQYLAEHG